MIIFTWKMWSSSKIPWIPATFFLLHDCKPKSRCQLHSGCLHSEGQIHSPLNERRSFIGVHGNWTRPRGSGLTLAVVCCCSVPRTDLSQWISTGCSCTSAPSRSTSHTHLLCFGVGRKEQRMCWEGLDRRESPEMGFSLLGICADCAYSMKGEQIRAGSCSSLHLTLRAHGIQGTHIRLDLSGKPPGAVAVLCHTRQQSCPGHRALRISETGTGFRSAFPAPCLENVTWYDHSMAHECILEVWWQQGFANSRLSVLRIYMI